MRPRRAFLLLIVALTPQASGDDPTSQIDRAIARGTRALIEAQAPDGAWRSRTYGIFKDGASLTPSVLKAVAFAPDVEGSEVARARAAAYLTRQVKPGGAIDAGPFGRLYPVYADSASALALSKIPVPGGREAIDAFLADLRRRQLVEPFGWSPDDPPFGAWGYAIEPASNRPGDHPVDADLSSTLFAIGTLRVLGASAEDPAIRDARSFIFRCQNFESGDAKLDDGGFFLTPTDPARNKAGGPRPGRYHSYGSTTADGLRALLRLGLAPDHPRVLAARRWLERNFSATEVPGTFEPALEPDRDATYFYYCWSLSHAFRSMGIRTFLRDGRKVEWSDELAIELIRRQRPDGTWANRYSASKEDDPLVATPFALGALANGPPRNP
ncbi:prenyltransferase/squalene oxidase repeat-containing protein [Tundrisphaera lichenicola]|uniref:prenyltransferase/squalene oxidase repeat-containing protein n=1 Tax=Tundrisphaera lichenicola TaxID=2029860 RepID=UPI003EBACCB7